MATLQVVFRVPMIASRGLPALEVRPHLVGPAIRIEFNLVAAVAIDRDAAKPILRISPKAIFSGWPSA
ncbi:hypothetical protein [Bradyrhizobium sp. B117]|uniref:hypothetical protein n=1 Tax=Bradyrhizobium sp. B117 TaxID=3140246 RepID=UPI0031842E2A